MRKKAISREGGAEAPWAARKGKERKSIKRNLIPPEKVDKKESMYSLKGGDTQKSSFAL